jgi:hypothetical protein
LVEKSPFAGRFPVIRRRQQEADNDISVGEVAATSHRLVRTDNI